VKIPSILRVMPLANWLALIALLALIIVGFAYCGERDRAREAENARDFVEGRTLSAGDAIQAIHELDRRNVASTQQAEEAINDIRQADPADRDAIARAHLRCLQHNECA
jgi:hypothetical protein